MMSLRLSIRAVTKLSMNCRNVFHHTENKVTQQLILQVLRNLSIQRIDSTRKTWFSTVGSTTENQAQIIDNATYERVCSETLNGLSDYFEEIIENASNLSGTDVAYGDGVLTINLGPCYGTYVINRQTPNKQIWLSSPTSGPKRYDFVGPLSGEGGKWIYKHNGESLHELLQNEIQKILEDSKVDFLQLPFSS